MIILLNKNVVIFFLYFSWNKLIDNDNRMEILSKAIIEINKVSDRKNEQIVQSFQSTYH